MRASLVAPSVKNPPASAGDIRDPSSIPGSGRPPGKGISSPLQYGSGDSSWRIPRTEEPGRLQSMGHTVGHDVAAKPPHQAREGTSANVYGLPAKTGRHDYIIQQPGDRNEEPAVWDETSCLWGDTEGKKERRRERGNEGGMEGRKRGKEKKKGGRVRAGSVVWVITVIKTASH